MSGLRFAFLTTFYPPYNFGGDGIGIQRFARGLVRAGHQVTVFHDADAYNTLNPGAEPVTVPDPVGVEVVSLKSKLGVLSPFLTQQLGRPVVNGPAIRRRLAAGRFDVINFHNVSLVGGPGLFKYGTGIKLYMAHEHWLVCPTHVLWRHGKELCDARECVRCQLNYRRPPQWWRWTGLLERESRHIDAFIAMSEFSRRKHREFGFQPEMEVVPYFLESDGAVAADPAGAETPHPRPYFLFVGRLEKIKGLDDVLPLFEGAEGPDLLIAGDGEYGETLRARAAGHSRVRFLGRVAVDQLQRYYRHARALIVPSVCFETFGIILIEAFRQGTPVIARRLGPFPELIEKSGAGLLFTGPAELVAAMRRFAEEPGLVRQCAVAGREAFEAHWSERVVIPKYLEVVRRVAVRKGNADVLRRSGDPSHGGTEPNEASQLLANGSTA
ncbi:MAG: glycosyltransferase family 4 protein [Gemmatimonadales bacterium]